MKEFYALRIAGDDGYLGHFDDWTDNPVPVLLEHALFYKKRESLANFGFGEIVKVTMIVEEVTV